MIVAKYFSVPTPISLGVVVLILAITVVVSIMTTQNRVATEDRK